MTLLRRKRYPRPKVSKMVASTKMATALLMAMAMKRQRATVMSSLTTVMRRPMVTRANTSRERKDSLTMAMKERGSQSTMVMKISQWTTGMRKDKMDTEWNSGTQCL